MDGVPVAYSPADMSKRADIATVEAAETTFGRIDVVVNNAAIQACGTRRHLPAGEVGRDCGNRPVVSFPRNPTRRLQEPHYRQSHPRTASSHRPTSWPLAAKHGLLGLTLPMTIELEIAEHRITVNAICPGYLVQKLIPETSPTRGLTGEQVIRDVLRHQGGRRVRFLRTDGAASIRGAALGVKGGWTGQRRMAPSR
jgi:3-hydroxybutyrate dehydrogenase